MICRQDGPRLDILKGGYRLRHSRESKAYVEYLLISQLVVTVSFLPASWRDVRSRSSTPGPSDSSLGMQLSQGLLAALHVLAVRVYFLAPGHGRKDWSKLAEY